MNPTHRHPTRTFTQVHARRAEALSRVGTAPFTRDTAREHGLTLTDLRSDAVTPVMRGVYLAGGNRAITHEIRCAAAILRAPADAWISHLDAARLFAPPVPDGDRIHVSVPRPTRGRTYDEMILHRRSSTSPGYRFDARQAGTSFMTTHPVDLAGECVPMLGLVDAVILLDALLTRWPHAYDLLTRLRSTGGAQAPRARRIAGLARAGSASPMETRLRLLLMLAGFPEPQRQAVVMTDEGAQHRFDLGYPDLRIGIEYDGAYHFESEHQKQKDILRDDALRRLGWVNVHVVSRGILRDPAGTVQRVAREFERCGHPISIDGGWATHLPQRDPRGGYREG